MIDFYLKFNRIIKTLTFLFLVITGLSACFLFKSCTHGRTESQHENPAEHNEFRILWNEKSHQFDEYFTKLNKLKGFNGNVLIAHNQNIIYKKSFGFANFKNKDSLNAQTAFQLASVTKQFTAVAVLMLHEKGLISLNDTVQKFIPWFPYKGITIRMLLCHRSGLPNYIYFAEYHIKDKNRIYSNEEIFRLMAQNPPPTYYRPDRRFDYSNTGYALLALIIETVSGQSYRSFLKQNIFIPLGMEHTFVYGDTLSHSEVAVATGYSKRMKPHEFYYLNGIIGDKGIYSTTEDLLKWDQSLYSGKIISPETLEQAFMPQGRKKNSRWNYGFGWRLFYLPDSSKILYHGGWWQGFHSLLLRIPKDTTTIIILKNREGGNMGNKEDIIKILYAVPDSIQSEPTDSILSLSNTF